MTLLKQSIKFILLTLLVSFTACNEKYPDLEDGMYAEIITNKGTMVANLEFEKTPVTVANFVSLAEGTNTMVDSTFKGKKYYDGIIFHRVIDGFMIQGGDPTASGSGGPGYKFEDEFDETLKHDKPGILSMANAGPGTNGSQFFITESATPNLDNRHTVFGELVEGIAIQDSISNVEVGPNDKPVEDVVIKSINIIRKGSAAKKFDANAVFLESFKEIERKKEEAEKKLNEAKAAFLENDKAIKAEMKTLPTGLGLSMLSEGDGAKPSSTDQVLIKYAGYLEDGTLFDTNDPETAKSFGVYNPQRDQQGGYQAFPMIYNETAGLIPGFREAMLNMNVGDKVRAYIPAALAYGERGAGNVIKPNSNLIFDLEIVGIAE
ncbi:peptidyl-prolyl cis-trans isomerase [Formosa agariphila KMM 3901]|uniref:peptidylprolyl isomerase n=1 Tax=Formosa agariphila (strain DSM 15362 / KCTC 12365 / LMG 23005 / KMM 3901 / M-2Alg 35-1) TaxID=1347342 RepID=T2KIZ7_FORAG|nr:peptidylprolyl isomerase [Formosa agariphila]CDF78770.1 peptidyl-prolyl cis-trans isomerase [Formosa agariphila KMM 3901]